MHRPSERSSGWTDSSRDRYKSEGREPTSQRQVQASIATSLLPPQLAVRTPSPPPPSEADINKLSAKVLRAELLGNTAEVAVLKDKLQNMHVRAKARSAPAAAAMDHKTTQVLMTTGRDGMAVPVHGLHVKEDRHDSHSRQLRKKFKADTHVGGERQRYFADEDKLTLQDLVAQERRGGGGDPDALYARLASKVMARTDDDDYTMDDMFTDRAGRSQPQGRFEERDRQQAVRGHQCREAALSNCWFCLENPKIEKHLIVSLGVKVYLAVPGKGSLTAGHSLLIPVRHTLSTVAMDEDVWDEMRMFQQCLVQMWQAQDKDVIFLETVMNLNKQYHTVVHAIPLDRDSGAMAPMYFKVSLEFRERSPPLLHFLCRAHAQDC